MHRNDLQSKIRHSVFTARVLTRMLSFEMKTFTFLTSSVLMLSSNIAVQAATPFEEHSEAAKKLYDKREFRKAIKEATLAIEAEPRRFEGYYRRGKCYSEIDSPLEGMPDFNKALELNPKFVDIWVSRALAYQRLKDDNKALEDLKRAVTLDPRHTKAMRKLLVICLRHNDFKTGIKYATLAIDAKDNIIENYERRGTFHALSGDEKKMRADYSSALALKQAELTTLEQNKSTSEKDISEKKQEFADVYNERGKAYATLNDFKSAMNDFEQALKIVPQDTTYMNNVGAVLLHTNQNPKALEVLTEACRLRTDSASIHSNLGIALERAGKHSEAKTHLEQALTIDSDKTKYFSLHQRVAQEMGNTEEAMADIIGISSMRVTKHARIPDKKIYSLLDQFDELIRLNPTDPANFYNRGVINLSQSRYAAAKEDFTTFLKLQKGVGESPTYGSILLYIALQNMHQIREAAEVMKNAKASTESAGCKQMLSLFTDEAGLADFMDSRESRQRELSINCFLGLKQLADGKKVPAEQKLIWVRDHGKPTQDEYLLAVSGLTKLGVMKPTSQTSTIARRSSSETISEPEISFK